MTLYYFCVEDGLTEKYETVEELLEANPSILENDHTIMVYNDETHNVRKARRRKEK